MELPYINFFTGFFLMNAMPHLLFGLLKIRFLCAFGFSPLGNIAYSFLNIVIALVLFHIQYGIGAILNHGILLGAGTVFFLYVLTGKFVYNLFQKK